MLTAFKVTAHPHTWLDQRLDLAVKSNKRETMAKL